jgi:hypothetical protein
MEDNLITSFFTAMMAFTNEVVGSRVKTIDMGEIKFVIIQKNMYLYGILCKSLENIALLDQIISEIHLKFLEYIDLNRVKTSIERIKNEDFNTIIDKILKSILSNEVDLLKEDKIINYLKSLFLDDEIEGILLLTDKGNLIFSALKRQNLQYFLKEVDFRVKICNNSILKLFYTSKHNELIFSEYVQNQYFIILVFDSRTKFGLAEHYLHKVVKNIENYLNS